MSEVVDVAEGSDGTLRVSLNRPDRRNALAPELVDALHALLDRIEDDASITALLLDGRGPTFCAGADLGHLRALGTDTDGAIAYLSEISRLADRLDACRVPTVCALRGHAVAGGLELALAADVVVAQSGTLIGDGHVKRLLLPAAGASVRMVRKLGEPRAIWLALSGELVPAERLGDHWLHAVVDDVDDHARRVVATLVAAQNAAQLAYKALLVRQRGMGAAEAIQHELDTFAAHWQDHDVPGVLATFLDRTTTEENR